MIVLNFQKSIFIFILIIFIYLEFKLHKMLIEFYKNLSNSL
jgi:hypothetical protein